MKPSNSNPAKKIKSGMTHTVFFPRSSFTFHMEEGRPCLQLKNPAASVEAYTFFSAQPAATVQAHSLPTPLAQQENKKIDDLAAAELLLDIGMERQSQISVTTKRRK